MTRPSMEEANEYFENQEAQANMRADYREAIPQMNIEELRQRMGAEATTEEAERMAELLAKRGILWLDEISERMTDEQFFALIPQCIRH